MHIAVYVPVVFAGMFGLVAPLLARCLPPALATWLLSVGGLVSAAGSAASLAFLSLTLIGQSSALAAAGHWSGTALRHHDPVARPIAAAAVAVLVILITRTAWVTWREWLALRRSHRFAATLSADRGELAVIDRSESIGYAVPGRPGRIVLSTGLIRRLDASQRRAVLKHERAHLTHHHHLHQISARLAGAANPLLRRLPDATSLACERWADEAAAAGSRRDVVAAALARAAGTHRLPDGLASLNAAVMDIAGRINALHAPRQRLSIWRCGALLALLVGTMLALGDAAHDIDRLFDLAQFAYRSSHGR